MKTPPTALLAAAPLTCTAGLNIVAAPGPAVAGSTVRAIAEFVPPAGLPPRFVVATGGYACRSRELVSHRRSAPPSRTARIAPATPDGAAMPCRRETPPALTAAPGTDSRTSRALLKDVDIKAARRAGR